MGIPVGISRAWIFPFTRARFYSGGEVYSGLMASQGGGTFSCDCRGVFMRARYIVGRWSYVGGYTIGVGLLLVAFTDDLGLCLVLDRCPYKGEV